MRRSLHSARHPSSYVAPIVGMVATGLAFGCKADRDESCRREGLVYDSVARACACPTDMAYACPDAGVCGCAALPDGGSRDGGAADGAVDAGGPDTCTTSSDCAEPLQHGFSRRYGARQPIDVARSNSGALFVLGNIDEPGSYGGALIEPAGGVSPDIVLARYEPDGTHRWSRRYGGTDGDHARALAVDANGVLYAVGSFHRRTDWGTGEILAAGEDDGFLVSLAPEDGAPRWLDSAGSSEIDSLNDVASSADGACVVGEFENSVTLGGTLTLEAVGHRNGVVACYRSDGTVLWADHIPGTAANSLNKVAVDRDGVVVAGAFSETISVGGEDLTSRGGTDLLVARVDNAGTFVWSLGIGGVAEDAPTAVHIMDGGFVLVAGTFTDTLIAGPTSLTSLHGMDAFVVGIDASGMVAFARRLSSTGNDVIADVVRDRGNTAHLVGTFSGTLTTTQGRLLDAVANTDVMLIRLDATGRERWAATTGGFGYERAVAAAPDSAHGLVMLAVFQGTSSFGGPELTSGASGDDTALVGLLGQ